MLPPPDFEALTERLDEGRRNSSPLLLFLGRACGRLAGAPDLDELAKQALALLDPDRRSVQSIPTADRGQLRELERAFLSAFPTKNALDVMLSSGYGLGVSVSKSAIDGDLASTVRRLLESASSTGQLDALLTAARSYNPGNAALRDAAARQASQSTEPSKAVLDEFRNKFRELSGLERYSLLQTIYRRIPVPAFYQELARLVKAGYVRQILTTNIDSLFEQALESLGLVRDVNFDVVLLGTDASRETLDSLDLGSRPLLLKLHGDISQGEFGVTPDEIEYAVHTAKRFIRSELEGDLVIVGYEGESRPLNDWLGRAPGEIWWVSADSPQGIIAAPHIKWLALGPPDLFAALAARLLTLRATSETATRSSTGSGLPAPTTQPSEQDLLLQEIERLKSETTALEHASGTGTGTGTGAPLQRQEQIAQRRRRIRELEDQLRALPAARDEILQLLDRVEQSVVEAEQQPDETVRLDPVTTQYFAEQVNTLREQYKGGQPNAHVVSAALGAALVLAERLGPSVIDPQDVQALATFGPTLTGRP